MHFILNKNNSSKFFSGSVQIFEVGLYTFTQVFPIQNLKNSQGEKNPQKKGQER